MQISITVILKESRGFDIAFELMFMPTPIWTENEKILPVKYDEKFYNNPTSVKNKFNELLGYCRENRHYVFEEKECIVLVRSENFSIYNIIDELIEDIINCNFKYRLITY